MVTAKNPDVVKWHCARCDKWNDIAHGMCQTCKAPHQRFADAYRLRDTLSSKELTYYDVVVPEILREVRVMREELQKIVRIGEEFISWYKSAGKL